MEQKSKNVSPFSNEARNAYVVEHMTDTVLRLLREKPLNDISISEIVENAEVGRTSFYRNFESKEEIVKRQIKKLFDEWEREYKAFGKESNAAMYGSLFNHLKKHSDFYLLLKERGLMRLLLEVYLEKWGPKPDYPNEWAYATAFLSYGTYGWIEEWINRGMQESAETMADLLSKNGMK